MGKTCRHPQVLFADICKFFVDKTIDVRKSFADIRKKLAEIQKICGHP